MQLSVKVLSSILGTKNLHVSKIQGQKFALTLTETLSLEKSIQSLEKGSTV